MEMKPSDLTFECFSELKIKVSTKIHYLKEKNLSFNQNSIFYDHLEKMSDHAFPVISKHGEITKGNGFRLKKLADGCDNAILNIFKGARCPQIGFLRVPPVG